MYYNFKKGNRYFNRNLLRLILAIKKLIRYIKKMNFTITYKDP